MKEDIINLYVNDNLAISDIAKKYALKIEEVYNILRENHYMVSRGTRRDWVLKAHDAIEYYINHQELSLNKIALMFKITPESLSKALKSLGYTIVNKQNIAKFNENIFDVIDTEEKAYWLGFIFADGYISSSPINNPTDAHYIFELCLALIDAGYLYKFDSFVQSQEPKVKAYNYKDASGKDKQHVKWTIANKHLWNTLNNIGCTPNKSLTLIYPNIPQHLKRHFARGYFDGDGSFGVYGQNELSLSCVGTQSIIDNLFSEIGDFSQYHHKDHNEATITLNASAKNAANILNYLYTNSTVYLDRKYNKYLELCRSLKEFKE